MKRREAKYSPETAKTQREQHHYQQHGPDKRTEAGRLYDKMVDCRSNFVRYDDLR